MRVPLLEHAYERFGRLKVAYLEAARWRPGVIAYGGYGSLTRARVMGRALMTQSDASRTWLAQRRGWRQFVDTEVPRQPVLVRLGQAARIVEVDIGGYLDVELSGHGLPAGWHDAKVNVIHRRDMAKAGRALLQSATDTALGLTSVARRAHRLGVRMTDAVSVPIRIVGDDEPVGIVSDVDDTILVSMLPHRMLAIRYAFVDKVATRQAVPGMARFLHDVQDRLRGDAALEPPLFFLSAGSWNTAPVLRHFLERAGFPKATILLRPWWIDSSGLPSSGVDFKKSELARLVDMLPQLKWMLIGDNGQHDPETYMAFSHRWPKKLLCIAIRSLLPREHFAAHGTVTERWRVEESDLPTGIPMLHGDDGDELMREFDEPRVQDMMRERLGRAHD